jgi:hypothetical protein
VPLNFTSGFLHTAVFSHGARIRRERKVVIMAVLAEEGLEAGTMPTTVKLCFLYFILFHGSSASLKETWR